jgi:integration host factor subunit alpha
MAERTVTRADLCEAVYQKIGLSRIESAAFVETVLKEITDCLERGETVKLSSFGSFVVRKKGQRIGRNPKTGTEVPISQKFSNSASRRVRRPSMPMSIMAHSHKKLLPRSKSIPRRPGRGHPHLLCHAWSIVASAWGDSVVGWEVFPVA